MLAPPNCTASAHNCTSERLGHSAAVSPVTPLYRLKSETAHSSAAKSCNAVCLVGMRGAPHRISLWPSAGQGINFIAVLSCVRTGAVWCACGWVCVLWEERRGEMSLAMTAQAPVCSAGVPLPAAATSTAPRLSGCVWQPKPTATEADIRQAGTGSTCQTATPWSFWQNRHPLCVHRDVYSTLYSSSQQGLAAAAVQHRLSFKKNTPRCRTVSGE
jgi:hypothetical protein